ncbi:MAG: hypothetical protein IT243_04605 [Bacteroidia bacterium]|nr:hypothetical protein [Bacteroidia bacterium]
MKSFDATKVLLSVNIHQQPDSLGYNIVKEFPKFIYPKIMDGLINLWNNPNKEIRISPATLTHIQKSSNTTFESLENLFIHEIWELNNNYFEKSIIGFTFINKTSEGNVSYGFVDYEDVKKLLEKINIPCNANGFVNISYEEVFKNMKFNFAIVQFGNDDFKDSPLKSLKIKKYIFENPKIKYLSDIKKKSKIKLVKFEILNNDSLQNKLLFSSVSGFFEENTDELYNKEAGIDSNYFKNNPEIVFSKIKVTEVIKYDEDGIINKISSVQFVMENLSLPYYTSDMINKIGITVNFKPLNEFLLEKGYELNITHVNNEEIQPFKSKEILSKLLNGDIILVKH